MKRTYILLFLQSLVLSCISGELPKATELSVSEGFENPVGFYDCKPSFSWIIPQDDEVKVQYSYEIVVASNPELLPNNADVWSSGEVVSDQSVDVRYEGAPLESRDKIYWQVRYSDQQKSLSEWSDVATIEMGLLSNSDWHAEWVKLPDLKVWEKTQYDTPLFRPTYLRKEFSIPSEVKRARLYITAKGLFAASVNGEKVGDDVLTPGWTPYAKRIETLSYDVTNCLNEGDNAIGLILAEGWHSGRFGPKRRWESVTTPPSIICQLEIEDENGELLTIVSDDEWRATNGGAIRTAGLYDGECYDANFELEGWDKPNFNDQKWQKVATESLDDNVELSPKKHATIKTKMKLEPQTMTLQGDKVLFDFGQNMVGVIEVNIPVNNGDTLVLHHGEMLTQSGELFTTNLGSAKSIDRYIAKEDGVINWHPIFTFHGFRYVEVSGYSGNSKPQLSWVKGLVQYSDFDMEGDFHSSNDKLNQLHSNIQWGLRGNFFDVPLDCPQRSERLGWSGDAQVFIPTSLYLANTHAFWTAWLASIREEQFSNGGVPVVIPNFTGDFAQAGWSDVCVIVPWELYFRTGDTRVLEDNYEMMQRWCRYHTSESVNGISHMSTVGDWLQPYSQQKDDRRGDALNDLISTAYYARSVEFTMKTAEVLGYTEDAAYYRELWNSISKAFEDEYFDSEGRVKESPAQTSYLLALGFGLLSNEVADKAIDHLVELIESADTHLRTGFIGTPLLAYVLDEYGELDLLYDILFQESYPSWFYSINQGATTMWERWDGYTHDRGFADRALSFNHYAYGAIGQWIYERVVGIAPLEAGYREILFSPTPNKRLSQVKGSYMSRYGKISSSWRLENDKFIYNITIPTNVTGKVVIPTFNNGSSDITINGEMVEAKIEDQSVVVYLPSGNFELVYNIK